MGLLDLLGLQAPQQSQGDSLNPVPFSTETGAPGLDFINNERNRQMTMSAQSQRQAVVKDAIAKYQAGDMKGAFASLGILNPEGLSKDVSQLANAGDIQKGKVGGELSAQTQYGANPAQLATIQGKYGVEAAQTKANAALNKPVIRKDPNAATGFSAIYPNRVNPLDGYQGQGQPAQSSTTPASQAKPADQGQKAPQLRPNQDISSEGKVITLSPQQQSVIKDARKTFDSETKDIVKGLDAAHQGLTMVNDPSLRGVEALERLRILRSVVQSRISNQEFQAFGGDMGAMTNLQSKLQKLQDGTLTPEMRTIYQNILSTTEKALSSQYDQHLTNAVERNPEVDSLVLKKHLVGSGPTVYQALIKKVKELPPDLQGLYNEAHDKSSSKDPQEQAKAKAALKVFATKYGIQP
jgi:hypothetical protein